jgi:hypothetical protein
MGALGLPSGSWREAKRFEVVYGGHRIREYIGYKSRARWGSGVEEVLRFPPGRGKDYDLGGSLLFVFFTSAIAWFAD